MKLSKSHRKCYKTQGMHVTTDLQFAKKKTVPILSIYCIKQNSVYKIGLIFLARGFENIQEINSALYSLRSGLSNKVSLGITFHLKKKVRGGGASESRYAKTICAKIWARKKKNRPVSGFFTKTAYVQVMNFIPVKVSTLYFINWKVN
jgi:hypothetical protein